MIKYCLLILTLLFITFCSSAQNASWLKGSWNGKAYVIGNPSAKSYDLVLTVNKLKGPAFEGVLRTIYQTDTFDTKVTGNITQAYMQISIGPWKVDCGNCKPQSLEYTIESKQFFFKGEAKGCSQECTWIFVFSKSLFEFKDQDQEILAALAPQVEPEQQEEPPVVQNEPPKDTIAAAPKKETVVEQRQAMPPAGDVVVSEKKPDNTPKEKSADLKNNNSLIKKPEVQEKRIAMPPAGSTILTSKKTLPYSTQKITALQRSFSSIIQKPVIKDKRIAMPPAGDIIVTEKKAGAYTPKQIVALKRSFSSIIQKPVIQEKRIAMPQGGDVVIAEKKSEPNVPKQINNELQKNLPGAIKEPEPELKRITMPAGEVTKLNSKKSLPEIKKPAATPAHKLTLLPPMYSDRKINLVKTLTVNADSILLKVYDNGEIDGDIITVTYNDKIIIDHLSLSAKSFTITIPVNKNGSNTLVMNANNLGEIPPNTARLEIIYGGKREVLDVSSDYKVSSALNILYQK